MSRQRKRLQITPKEQIILDAAATGENGRDQLAAKIIGFFAEGEYTYREIASQLGVSLNTTVRILQRARKSGIAEVFRVAQGGGRPSGMERPEVRQLIADLLASEDTVRAKAEYIVNQLMERFQIRLATDSLKYWLRKWKLRRRRRPTQPSKRVQPAPELLKYIDSELLRIGDELKRQEYYFPESHNENRMLRLQQDMLLAVYKSAADGYTQVAIAEELERREATISRWLSLFRGNGGNVPAVKKLLAMHQS